MELRDTRLRRMTMRSMRRGIREMDLLMSRFATTRLAGLSDPDLDLYDDLLEENDQDLYQWVSGQIAPPDRYRKMIADIAAAPGPWNFTS